MSKFLSGLKALVCAVAALICGGAWAIEPVVKWDGDLAAGEKNGYTLSYRNDDNQRVAFANGQAVLTQNSNVSHGLIVSWDSNDASTIQSQEMTVLVRYYGYTGSANHALFAAQWESTSKETVVYSNGAHTRIGISKGVTTSSYEDQVTCTSDISTPADGIMMVTFANKEGELSGTRVAFAPATAAGYGPFELKHERAAVKYNEKFKGLKIGGTIGSSSHFYRPGMKITGLAIYDKAMTLAEAQQLPEFTSSTVQYAHPAVLQSDFVSTGWKVSSVDELVNWNYTAEMIGGSIGGRPVAAKGCFPVKLSDGTVKVEFQASNSQTKGVSAIFRVVNGVVEVKGKAACYFNAANRVGESMFNDDGTPRNPGGTTIASTLATSFDAQSYGVQNILATPNYYMCNAAGGKAKAGYQNRTYTLNLPVAAGYASGSKVVVKSIGLATEGSGNDLPAKIEVNGIKSSSRVGPVSDPTIQGTDSVTGYMITYNFTEPLVLTVGTAATSFKFLNASDVDVTANSQRFALVSRATASGGASTGMKFSALSVSGESSWAPICTVVGVPVDDWYFGKGSEYWKNVYQGPATGVDANFNSADQWALASEKTKAAMYSGSDNWEPALVNGDLLANIEKGGDGYKTIETGTTDLDGWSLKLGLVNNVKLSVNKIGKLQDNSSGGKLFIGVDATSKLYVAQYGNGNCQGAITFDVASEDGVEFNCNANGGSYNTATINYIFRGNGSMKINGSYNIGASHKVSHVELELGSGEYVVLKERKLVGFTSSNISDANISFDTNPEIVITDNDEIEGGVYTGSEASLNDCLGKARIVKKTDGIYAQYFGYGDTQTTAVLTISGLPENLEMSSVVANEVTVTPEGDGTYVVPLGAPITISYATTVENKVPALPSKVFAGILADTTISSGHPTAIDFPKILWGSDTNTDYLSKDENSPSLLFASTTSLADISNGDAKLVGKMKGAWVGSLRDATIVTRSAYVEGSNSLEIQCQMYDGSAADLHDYYTKVQNLMLKQYQVGEGKFAIYAVASQGYYLGDGTDSRGVYIVKGSGTTTPSGNNAMTAYEAIKLEIDQTHEASYNGKNYASVAAAIEAAQTNPGHGSVTLEADTPSSIVVPSGVVLELNNHQITDQVRVLNGGWITENGTVKIDGFTTSFDIKYNDKYSFDYQQEPKATSNIGSGEASYFQGDEHNNDHGIYLKHQPYIGSIPESFFTSTDQLTMAVIGTMPAAHNTIFAHMGSAANNYNGIFLATGENDNEVVVAYNKNATPTVIATMTVPNAATARHLYIITKSDTETKASFTVYLDGDEFTTQTFDKFILVGGYQLGRTFNTQVTGFNTVSDDSTAYVNVFRAYDRVISQAEINRYKEVYQYKSIDGNYERTFATGSVDWSADNAWTRTDGETDTTVDCPTRGMVSATFAGDTSVTVNVTEANQYEKLTIAGTGTITFNKGAEGSVKLTPVATEIQTPIVLSENTLDISGGPTTLGTNGRVTFDFSGLTEAAVANDYPFAQKVTGMTSATSDKFTLTPTTIGRVALSLEQRDDKCYYVVGTIAPMDVYYVEGYLSATAPTSPTFKDADDNDINFYAGDTLIIGSKVKTGVVDARIADDFVGTKFKIEKDFAFHAGVTAAILDGATITVADNKTLTINNSNSENNATLGNVTFDGAKVVIDAEIPAGAITGTATVELSSNGTLVPTSIANALTGQGTVKLVQAQTNSDSALNTWLTSEQLANFEGTIWCAKGRFKSSTPVPNAVTIKVTNGAKFYINAASTWYNHFVLSGLGWSGDGTYEMGPTALRFENANCTLGESAVLEFVEETVNGQVVTPAVGVQNCNPVVAATLKGTCGFRLLAENASTFEFTNLLSSNEFTGSVTLNANCSLKTSTDFPVARVLSGVEGNVIKEVLGEDDTVVYSLVSASEDHPITPDSGDVVIPVVPDAGIAIQPGADVTVPPTTDVSKIEVKYGDTVLSGNDGVVAVAINTETGKIELSIKPEKEDEVRPTVNAMATPTEASTDKVAFTITSPIPGLFYAVSSCDTPDGTFESAIGDQATSSEAKTVSIPMTFGENQKVKYYRVNVKATK